MRILINNYEYPPLGGGGGVAAANLAHELSARGHQIDYVTSWFPGLARSETDHGINVYREPVLGRTGLQTASIMSMLTYPLSAIRRARQLHRQIAYDLIHSHFAIPSGPAGYLLSKMWHTPHIVSVHGGDIFDPSKKYSPHRNLILRATVKRVLNQANIVIPQSEDICDRISKLYKTSTEVRRIPLGFVIPRFQQRSRAQLGLPSDSTYAIAVSRLVPRKDYPTLLQAVKASGVGDLRLLVVGGGPEEPKLRQLAKDLALEDRVHFLGHVSEEEKFQYLSVSDFFALASLHEGFGIVYQEAMYCGLPIVTTNVGGQTDFLTDAENALLARPGDVEALGAAIRRLAKDTRLRSQMAEANRAKLDTMSIEQVATQYERAYHDALAH